MCHQDAHRDPAALPRANGAPPADAAAPTSAAEAVALVRAGLGWLASADATELTGSQRAECLRGLGQAESVHLAATARVLAAFDAADDYTADGQCWSRPWLVWQTRTTRSAAGAKLAWMRRLAARPAVAGALAAGSISVSYARRICDWCDQLPADAEAQAEEILAQAAAGGADVYDLAVLFGEIRGRTARPDTDGDDRFGRRRLVLDEHYGGHARLDGDLTPHAAAAVQAVLDALGGKAGPEDARTKAQRDHDALEEACRRLIASGCLPNREGQPVHIQLHMTLSQLTGQPADPALAADLAAGAGGAAAPPGADCDATLIPIVTGRIDPAVLARLAGHWPGVTASPSRQQATARTARAAAQLTIAQAVALLSGPGGLAARLRGQLPGPAGQISLPLDVGTATETIPAAIRRAVTRRDRHCRFPGCDRPPAACQVHHLRPRADGGETSVTNCCLLCSFHHLIAVHRWGWQLTLHPDGTTTAASPDRDRVLHSHAPPGQAA